MSKTTAKSVRAMLEWLRETEGPVSWPMIQALVIETVGTRNQCIAVPPDEIQNGSLRGEGHWAVRPGEPSHFNKWTGQELVNVYSNSYKKYEAWGTLQRNSFLKPTPDKCADGYRLYEVSRKGKRAILSSIRIGDVNKDGWCRVTCSTGDVDAPITRTRATLDRMLRFAIDGPMCHLCGIDVGDDWHLDHVIPLSKGGPDVLENTAVAHEFCNLSKGNRGTSPVPHILERAMAAYLAETGTEWAAAAVA